ncbi:DUF3467 domain-containing protein [Marinobacterium mangrovicola]|uniref:Uncharacterized protein DUF3467 n=1 Tax=Marinobacterium mangrovicola TaxID=1476959 RepID=A0A4R1GHG0_9GAMM|nr:DUF3467 domain-containing protein [Marinobacterium mangrovicola]TCK07578.1 uncharacterized protein DUF3467 [Marinobacterium mangrovicola]
MDKKQSNGENGANVEDGRPAAPIVDWDDSDMRSTYANVVNASSTREEVNLFFGTNETWKISEKQEFHVKLSDRLVLNPHAAKRLWLLMGAVLKQYESRYGSLDIGTSAAPTPTTPPTDKSVQ